MSKTPVKAIHPRQKDAWLATIQSSPTVTSKRKGSTSTLHCPHCHVARISLLKKLLFGPVFRFRCRQCGHHWRVSWWSVVVAILTISTFAVLLLLAWLSGLGRVLGPAANFISGLALVIGGLVIARLVPVRKAD